MANLICMTTDIEQMQRKAFLIPSDDNEYVNCADLNEIDFNLFKETSKSNFSCN